MNADALVLVLALFGAGQEPTPPAEEPPTEEPPTDEPATEEAGGQTIVAGRRDLRRVVGSAHTVDKETLERFEPDDVHRALRTVPGVYVRDEDGMGLRPNIGLRGASSDRSAKVALLEDGVLFAPAPYAAPAAYYFPLTTRMVGVEVFKGPAAIRQGPHTVGGALNLRTRPAPMAPTAALDAGVGFMGPALRGQSRLHGYAGTGDETWGVILEGARVQSDGFKHIQGQPDASTGFVRDDVMLKARVGTPLLADVRSTMELKLGYGSESSDESYLGLSDADFRRDGLMRYAASANDHMEWQRTQAQLRWSFAVQDDLELDVVGYQHNLDRTWNKVNGVRGAPALHDVLTYADVGVFPLFVHQLRGDIDPADAGVILIGPNQRTYFSHGIAAVARGRVVLGPDAFQVAQKIELGARLHQDGIDRLHSERGFSLADGRLVDLAEPDVVTANNTATATALALHIADEVRVLDVAIVPGARLEVIRGTLTDRQAGEVKSGDQIAFLPGIGAAWQPWQWLVLVAGVHRGFSPIAPGQSGAVQPETSTNGEAGFRFDFKQALGLSLELIGFYSRYENILGECTYSSGCIGDAGTQENGGAADIAGAELAARHDLALPWGESRLRSEASYTFTRAVFLTTFNSSHPLFGAVRAGDEMAYVPTHQAAASAALVAGPFDVGASLGLVSWMRDQPGQGEPVPEERTDAQAVLDLVASYALTPSVRLALRVDNALDQRAIVSRRPFGARPGKPRSALASIEVELP